MKASAAESRLLQLLSLLVLAVVLVLGRNEDGVAELGGSADDLQQEELLDAVVVGSGLAGLIAARDMEKAGLDVQVLEAQDYIGGRMVRKELSPIQSVDFGGQWVGKNHMLLKALTDELGLTRFKAPSITDNGRVVFGGEVLSAQELITSNFNDYVACSEAFQSVFDMIPPDTYPFEELIAGNETLRRLDRITVQEFINNIGLQTDVGRFLCKNLNLGFSRIAGHYPGEPATVSLLAWAFANKNGTNAFTLSPEEELINGAAGQIPPILAGDLKRSVRLNDPVIEVSQFRKNTGGKILATVRTLGGRKYRARNVVVATSPYISGAIHYDPPLSWERHQLNQHKPMGTVAKILIQYESKIWEDSGALITSPEDGMLTLCVDATDSRSQERAVYVCLINGEQYDQFAMSGNTIDERVDAVLRELSQTLGDAALSPLSVDVGNWPVSQYVQGSYSSYWPPQAWTRFGKALLRPEGVIQWCSTEYALKWAGYFEGAIESGMRAARAVIDGNIGELRESEPHITLN